MRKLVFVMLALLFFAPQAASAAFLKAAQKENGGNLNQKEIVKNAYLAGNSVSFSGQASQDLLAVGNNLNISGTVGGSLMAAGNSVSILGPVNNSVRVAGANINAQNAIGSDFLAAGATIILAEKSTVGDDFIAGGGTIDLLGQVKGNARLAGSQISINGQVNGDVTIKGNGKVTIGDNAVINGNLSYQASEPAMISSSAKVLGTTTYTQVKKNAAKPIWGKFAKLITLFSLIMLAATFLTLLILVNLFPKLARKFINEGTAKPWNNIGLGFVYLAVMPIAAIILLATIVGLPLGGLIITIYAVGLTVAKLLMPIFVGSYLIKWFRKDKAYPINWLTILVGVIVTALLGAIPFIGWLAVLLIYLLALSQVFQNILSFLRTQKVA